MPTEVDDRPGTTTVSGGALPQGERFGSIGSVYRSHRGCEVGSCTYRDAVL